MQTDIQRIEENIANAQQILSVGVSLNRLLNNADFKKVILQGYFEKEAIRLVHLKIQPAMQTEAMQKSVLAQIDAIGALVQYFQTVEHKANLAEKGIASDEDTLDELRKEGAV